MLAVVVAEGVIAAESIRKGCVDARARVVVPFASQHLLVDWSLRFGLRTAYGEHQHKQPYTEADTSMQGC